MRFKKIPVEIEAVQFVPHEFLPEEFKGAVCLSNHSQEQDVLPAHIHTLEGVMTINPLDWIIKGVKGEFYPCKPDIFALTYEALPTVP